MSDFEINARITGIVEGEDFSQWAVTADETAFYHCGFDGSQHHSVDILDYCNNPSDMIPLVFENNISLIKDCDCEEYYARPDFCDINGDFSVNDGRFVMHENPLRAAAIVYLLMQGGNDD